MGALAIVGEHANFAIQGLAKYADLIGVHSRYHLFMAVIYTVVGAGGTALVGIPFELVVPLLFVIFVKNVSLLLPDPTYNNSVTRSAARCNPQRRSINLMTGCLIHHPSRGHPGQHVGAGRNVEQGGLKAQFGEQLRYIRGQRNLTQELLGAASRTEAAALAVQNDLVT